ncbi:MAG: hypothetical protein KC431_11100, partial [Myxococcales bacterium]|nr:hypothetical protein [Myxococcales bacterium]
LGYSMGGALALELALALIERGREVSALILVDSLLPEPVADPRAQTERWARRLLDDVLHQDPASIDEALRQSDNPIDVALDHARSHGVLPPEISQADTRLLLERVRAHGLAFERYQPRPFPGPVLYVGATATAGEAEVRRDWGSISPDFSYREFEASHTTILTQPAVEYLADEIRNIITQVVTT